MQLSLFAGETGKKQTLLQDVDPSECAISRFNTRKTRPSDAIEKLAERISQNGFELTRAVWAYRNGSNKLEVFAGGTRLEAAKCAGVKVAVVLHEGYSEKEISKLSDQDNENDEYHSPVLITDVWAEYVRLNEEENWTQQEIADAKGCERTAVGRRIQYHHLPKAIKNYVCQGFLTEGHLLEIDRLCVDTHLSSWISTEQIQIELASWAYEGHTTRETRATVKKWKQFIDCAQQVYESLKEKETLYDLSGDEPKPYIYRAREAFIEGLAKRKARSISKVNEAEREVQRCITDNLRDYKKWVDARTAEEARKAIRLQREEDLLAPVHLGDFRDVMAGLADDSVDLIFTDPPYDEKHIKDYGDLAQIAARVLKPKGSLIVYAGHYALPRIFKLMCPHLIYWWQLIVKHSGGAARQPGKWVFVEYKPLLWFVKEGRRDHEYVSDFIHSQPPDKAYHEWQQDLAEAKYCIERLTNEGDLVVDPFCGSGTTAIAALEIDRNFWTCDIDSDNLETAKGRLLEWMNEKESSQDTNRTPNLKMM